MPGRAMAKVGLPFNQAELRDFFTRVPALFQRAQAAVHEPYQRLLYTVEHPLHESTTDAIEQAFHLPHPAWNPGSRREAIDLLDKRMRYPSTDAIADLRAIAGLDLRILSHYLHFFHHAYPIYDKESLRGLAKLGVDIPWTPVRNPDIYAFYIAAIEDLKERIPFWDVPETNVYLTRIVQGALHELGRSP